MRKQFTLNYFCFNEKTDGSPIIENKIKQLQCNILEYSKLNQIIDRARKNTQQLRKNDANMSIFNHFNGAALRFVTFDFVYNFFQ